MKVVDEFPPNIDEIKQIFPIGSEQPVFAYGDTIYNPYKLPIPDDIIVHEEVHCRQQKDQPDWWWKKYLVDSEFRKDQEAEAYAAQYNFVRQITNAKLAKECLFDLSSGLSGPLYALGIPYYEAETLIRQKSRALKS